MGSYGKKDDVLLVVQIAEAAKWPSRPQGNSDGGSAVLLIEAYFLRTYRDKCLGAPADLMKRRISLDKRCERSFGCSINSDGAAAVQHQAAAAVQRRNLITSDGALRLVIKIVEIPTLTCAVQRLSPDGTFRD